MSKEKLDELIAATKLGELISKKEDEDKKCCKKCSTIIIAVLAIVGAVAAVAGIAYVIESYGLICNKTLLAEAGYSVDDIKSFDDLKKVAEDITSRSDELGFAAFTSAGMDGSSDWRFKTHLANLPIYFEYQEDGINSTDAIKGTYLDNYRNIWDLYVNNSTCAGKDW